MMATSVGKTIYFTDGTRGLIEGYMLSPLDGGLCYVYADVDTGQSNLFIGIGDDLIAEVCND